VPPVYTLSNFLFVSPGTQTWHCHFSQLTTIRSWWLFHPPILYKVFNIESNICQVVQIWKHLKTTLDKQRYQRQMNIQAWAHTVADSCCRVVQSG
jgi:hypothetical protein